MAVCARCGGSQFQGNICASCGTPYGSQASRGAGGGAPEVVPGTPVPRAAPAQPAALPADALKALPVDALQPIPADAVQPTPAPPAPSPAPQALDMGALSPLPAEPAPPKAEEAPEFVNRKCPSCDAPVAENAGKFCDACGKKLPQVPSAKASAGPGGKKRRKRRDDDMIKCFECGTRNEADASLCRDCGMPLRKGI